MQARGENKPEMLSVCKARFSDEADLQHAWNALCPGCLLRTVARQKLVVLSPGTWNLEAGPDFKNAKFELDGRIISGDVELHLCSSDWKRHGHERDPAYANVILHVVADDDRESLRSEPSIPTLVLTRHKRIPLRKRLAPSGRCSAFFEGQSPENMRKILTDAGRRRFREKSDTLLKEMLERGSEHACLKSIFEAAGYKNNRKNFLELFSRFSEYPHKLSDNDVSAVLWGESGLLPDPALVSLNPEMEAFITRTWKSFWLLRKSSRQPISWLHSGARPLNSPERRIAALCGLLKIAERRPLAFCRAVARLSEPKAFWGDLRDKLIIRDALWDGHYSCLKSNGKASAVFGEDKIIELMVNVLLPALHAWGRLEVKSEWSFFAESSYLSIPAPVQNRNVKIAVQKCFAGLNKDVKVLRSAACVQGVLHLYKAYCEKAHGDCGACLFFNSL